MNGTDNHRGEYLSRLRTRLDELNDTLRELEHHARDSGEDARALTRYERQFEALRRRRGDVAGLLTSAPTAAAEWAAFRAQLELAWRDLLADVDRVRADVAPGEQGRQP